MNIKLSFYKLLHIMKIDSELEDHDAVYEEIKKNAIFKGTNLWILFFAIIVASVGLNMNSTAVIIGAMLISPLMGPINAIGYSISTYDFHLFKISIKNFIFAIIVALSGSTLYFAFTPISTESSELLARTSPTIYDVIIALFGGLAGIIAMSSKLKGNVIPGVAIATALMPPLCTTGYGLATGKWNFAIGAFYLFTINTIFIALASGLVSQLLNFPIRNILDEKRKRKINNIITVVIILCLLPSVYLGYRLVLEERFKNNAKKYVSNVSQFEGIYLLKNEILPKENTIILVYGGVPLNEKLKEQITLKAKDFNLLNTNIVIKEGLVFNFKDFANDEVSMLKEKIINLKLALEEKNKELNAIMEKQKIGAELLEEIKIIIPIIENIFYAETKSIDENNNEITIPIVLIKSKDKLTHSTIQKVNEWLKKRLKNDNVKLFLE
ncbi:MAG TPA: TIGR00341 family protein [Ignavibacteriales bacterium]|nr:TIGR00341 family protein [Ignavibacteriales bacterium]HOL80505.1 TIGR00341 family protein [Ignavibacteriales bacterium]HPD67334.1 TIGR00341 family protein [Ignavibacteriales bacterium]HPP33159.1 TIGR00341 family protein [Ignavibacteriales bacterium]HRR19423.1 TIGR00341 family protein [Ignavibacteriales bacterium]